MAIKRNVMSPFQLSIKECFANSSIDIRKINGNQKLYEVLDQNFSLQTSETLFREVEFSKKGENKKLKYEDGLIHIFKVDDEDESLKLLSSEKFSDFTEDYKMRHKIRSVESRLAQLLFQAEIKTDYQKIKETRSKQVLVSVFWADKQIRNLNVEFLGLNKVLNCQQKDQLDICTCRSM